MTGRGKRPAAQHPAVYLDDAKILEHTRSIRALLLGLGVRDVDVDDVVQETVLGAWRSMTAGRFRPDPKVPLKDALRAWLMGIAWRQMTHYRDRAHRRYEVSSGLGWDLAIDPGLAPDEVLAVRVMIRALRRLPPRYVEILALYAVGASTKEIAEMLAIPLGTVSSRIRLARKAFRELLQGAPRRRRRRRR